MGKYKCNDLFECVQSSGTTLVCASIMNGYIVTGNIGDSRCVLATAAGNSIKATPLTTDHKPNFPKEKARIEQADPRGEVIGGRVYPGGLAMSRSIGDFDCPHAINTPTMKHYKIKNEDKFLILASDGVWDLMSNEEACGIVNRYYPDDIQTVVDKLVDKAKSRWAAHNGGRRRDDITAIVVKLH